MKNNYKLEKKGTRYFYKVKRVCYYIQDEENEVKTCLAHKKDFNYRHYEMQSGYEATLKGLQEYRNDFKKWIYWLSFKGINYLNYATHDEAIVGVFLSKSTNAMKSLNYEKCKYTEFKWSEKCSNGGLISIDETILNKEIECFGYDMNSWYPWLLAQSELKVPKKEGKEYYIEKLSYPLKYGYYCCKVSGVDINKIFCFSKNDVYTHYSLNFINEYNKNVNEEKRISVKLILNTSVNAYIYDDENLVETKTIFKDWYDKVMKLKSSAPANKLVKRLSSSLWGYLTQYERQFCDNDDEYYDLDVSYKHEWEKETEYKILKELYDEQGDMVRYEMIKTQNPYKHGLARLKSFLTSYSRSLIGQLVIDEGIYNDVVRVHTDGIVLNKKHDFSNCGYNLNLENKTTGKFTWYSCNTNNVNMEKRKNKQNIYKQTKI